MAKSTFASRNTHLATRKSESWRSFKIATWLGWQIESNWNDPFLFAVYSIVKPLAGASILVVMYGIITHSNFTNPMFPYIYLGNAFYIYVGAVMTGVSWAVVDDREHYKTLKYMYIAPIRIPLYLLGRGVARFITGSIAVFITVTAGVLFLHVPLDPLQADWPLFFLTLFLGVVMLALMGLLLAGVTLLIVRHEGFIGEATAGALYIFSGAVFPLDVLPAWLTGRLRHADNVLVGTFAPFAGGRGGAGLPDPVRVQQLATARHPARTEHPLRHFGSFHLPPL